MTNALRTDIIESPQSGPAARPYGDGQTAGIPNRKGFIPLKKQIRKAISVLLCLVLLCAVIGGGAHALYARAAEQENETVAEIYLCFCSIRIPYLFGHTWISIVNTSEETLTVGPQAIEPGQMMTAGLHAGAGMVINRELGEFRGNTVTAIRDTMTREDLQRAANEIMSSRWDHYYLFSHNCTNFAAAVWKAATGESYATAIFPFVLKSQVPANRKIGLYVP